MSPVARKLLFDFEESASNSDSESVQDTVECIDSPSCTIGSVKLEYEDDTFSLLDESFLDDDEENNPFETPPRGPVKSQSSPNESRAPIISDHVSKNFHEV